MRHPAARCAALLLVLILPALPLAAREPTEQESRRADRLRAVDLPFVELELAGNFTLLEGPRSLGESFPYLVVLGVGEEENARGHVLTPENLGHFLVKAPQEGGHIPAAIRTAEQARAAAMLFIPGRAIRTEAAANRIITVAEKLEKEFKHLMLRVTEYRPKSYQPTVQPLAQDRSIHPTEAWEVSFTALETDRHLSLVHVVARVTADGEVTYARHPIVDGPMTSWQTKVFGEYTDAHLRKQAEMVAEAERARREYCRAAGPAASFEDLWAAARIAWDRKELEALIGQTAPGGPEGSGLLFTDLPGETRLVFQLQDDKLKWARLATDGSPEDPSAVILRVFQSGR